jgi:16S rRNA (uracil1498-N3)-methyltransferase
VSLPEGEAHHLSQVLRLTAGDAVEVFNGQGLVGSGRIGRANRRAVEVDVAEVERQPAPRPRFFLATAVPKGERFDWLIEKATELGVDRLIPLETARTTVVPRGTKLERLRQTVIAACKQCRRSYLMELAPVTGWREFLAQVRGGPLYVAHPGGNSLSVDDGPAGQTGVELEWVTACVGPEGGFTEEELDLAAEHGGRLIRLGENILRIETAAVAMAALWATLRRQLL